MRKRWRELGSGCDHCVTSEDGDILGDEFANQTFDPTEMDASSADARRNRCISDVAERRVPPSEFCRMLGALDEGVVTLGDQFDCENGAFMYAGRVLHDAHPFGVLSVEEILFHSSNMGALRMRQARLLYSISGGTVSATKTEIAFTEVFGYCPLAR